jgi:hypothetical protein
MILKNNSKNFPMEIIHAFCQRHILIKQEDKSRGKFFGVFQKFFSFFNEELIRFEVALIFQSFFNKNSEKLLSFP